MEYNEWVLKSNQWERQELINKYGSLTEAFNKELNGVFKSALDDGVGVYKIDKNGNIKHISNTKVFKDGSLNT